MRFLRVLRLACITVLALAAFGCDQSASDACRLSESLVGPGFSIVPAAEVDFEASEAPRDDWVEISREAPSFAGMWFDGDEIVVLVADPADADAAVEQVRSRLPGTVFEDTGIRTSVVDYSYLELARWQKVAVVNLANLDGGNLTTVGVDEVANAVGIGVRPGTCLSGVRRILQEAGIPADALVFEEEEPAQY